MLAVNFIVGQTKVTIHWEVILPIICFVIIFVLIRSIISIIYGKRVADNIKTKEYEKALHNAKILNRNCWTHTLNEDLTKLMLALLNLYFDNKQEFLDKISKIKNSQLIAIKYFWEAVYFYSDMDIERANQLLTVFLNSSALINKKIVDYGIYKSRLLAIHNYCENKNDETLNALKDVIQKQDSLQSDLIAKLFLSN